VSFAASVRITLLPVSEEAAPTSTNDAQTLSHKASDPDDFDLLGISRE
jgi:hypothetical protein